VFVVVAVMGGRKPRARGYVCVYVHEYLVSNIEGERISAVVCHGYAGGRDKAKAFV
jgi:hypothetical protein